MTTNPQLFVAAGPWVHGPVSPAIGFWKRWRGIRRHPNGVVLPTSSVHGFGLQHPLIVAGIDRRGRVLGIRMLRPNRVVRIAGAQLVVELPVEAGLPSGALHLSALVAVVHSTTGSSIS